MNKNTKNSEKLRYVIFGEAFTVASCKKMEPFLTFPHSQITRLYRCYQFFSGTPLPAVIKAQYDKAVEYYRQMITVAMKPYEWIEWMKSNFDEEDWVANFECKLAEHFYMKEIWLDYIKFLEGRKSDDILDVYRRYCRLFLHGLEIQEKYYKKACNANDSPWKLEIFQFYVDFYPQSKPKEASIFLKMLDKLYICDIAILKSLLKKCSSKMCKKCFEIKNRRYFDGKLNYDKLRLQKRWFWQAKECAPLDCYLCGESFKENESTGEEKVIEVLVDKSFSTLKPGSVEFHPVVRIHFHDNLGPAIPLSIFHYLLENATHQILSKLYTTSKYFFIKKLILICCRICIFTNPKESYVQRALCTNVKTILKSPFKKYCCGITLIFKDSTYPNLLSKCLPKLCCCLLTNLIIFEQNLTVDEFKYLLQSAKMDMVYLEEVRFFKANGKMMKIDEIIDMLPTVTELLINIKSRQMYTRRTSQNIASLLRDGTKFDKFCLFQVPDTFDLEFFQIFLREHMQLRGYFRLEFRDNVNEMLLHEYDLLLTEVKDNWLPTYQGPRLLELYRG